MALPPNASPGPDRPPPVPVPAAPVPVAMVLDEPVDRWFSRPLARGVVWVLAKTPITANQCTALSAVVGIASGVALGLQQGLLFTLLTAAFLVLDCCDGQLARMGRGGGLLGRAVDGVGDYLTAISIHLGLLAWLVPLHGWALALPSVLAAGASMSWGALLLDRYKRRFKGEVEDATAVEAAMARERGWRRAVLALLKPYFKRLANERPAPDLAAYQRGTRLPMRLFLLCGHTTHVTVWSVLALLELPLAYAFAAVVPFNLLALLALLLQRRGERAAGAVGTARA